MIFVRQRAEPEAALDLGDRQLVALEVLVGELVVHVGDGLDHHVAVLVGLGPELVRDVDDVDLVAQVVAVVDRLHLDQVDDPLEAILAADRDLDRHGVRAEPLLDAARPRARSRRRSGRAC